MPLLPEPNDEDAFAVLRHDALGVYDAMVNVVAERVGQRVVDDLERAALVMPGEVLDVFQNERVGLVVVNEVGQLEEEVALFLVLKAVFLAEADFFGDARDAERLAGKSGAQNVVRRDGVVRHGMDVAVRSLAEVGFVSDLGLLVPVRREDALAVRALESDAEAADAAEEVNEAERLRW